MILLVHMLFGAAIGASIKNPYLAILLALLGHYFLDIFPHIEYSIKNIENKLWKTSLPDFLKVFLDISLGIFIISIFAKGQLVVYLCGFIALIPDGLTLVSSIFKNNILEFHNKIHNEKIHYLTKQKKFPVSWRITAQVVAAILSIMVLAH